MNQKIILGIGGVLALIGGVYIGNAILQGQKKKEQAPSGGMFAAGSPRIV